MVTSHFNQSSYPNAHPSMYLNQATGLESTPNPFNGRNSDRESFSTLNTPLNHGRLSHSSPFKNNRPPSNHTSSPFATPSHFSSYSREPQNFPKNPFIEPSYSSPGHDHYFSQNNRSNKPPPSPFFASPSHANNKENDYSHALVLARPTKSQNGIDPATIVEDPVGALYLICQQRNLHMPQYFHKSTSGSHFQPYPKHGMDIVLQGTKKSTAIIYDTKEDAETAAAFLGFEILGIPYDRNAPPPATSGKQRTFNKQHPMNEKLEFKPLSNSSTPGILDTIEPNLGTMGNTYFQTLQRLLHRYHMIMPKFTHEAISAFPSRHLVTLEFYGHHFEAMDAKKSDARQLVAKQAYEFLSTLPEFKEPPQDYRALLSALARNRKWHSPRFFDPLNGSGSLSEGQIGVIVGDYQFTEKWPEIYSSTGAKQLVAKKAYEFLMNSEPSSLTPIPKDLPSTYTMSRKIHSPSPAFCKSRVNYDVYEPSLEASKKNHEVHGPIRLSQRGKKGAKAHFIYDDNENDEENEPVAYKYFEPSYASQYNFAFDESAFQSPDGHSHYRTMQQHEPDSYPSYPSYNEHPNNNRLHYQRLSSPDDVPQQQQQQHQYPHHHHHHYHGEHSPMYQDEDCDNAYAYDQGDRYQHHGRHQRELSPTVLSPPRRSSTRSPSPLSFRRPSSHYNFAKTEKLDDYYDAGADIASHYFD